jgi:hypothetical protein
MKKTSKLIVDIKGNKEWTLNGKLHRLDGPAMEYADGSREWWVDGMRHRTDGPAIEYANGHKSWYVYDRHIKVWWPV